MGTESVVTKVWMELVCATCLGILSKLMPREGDLAWGEADLPALSRSSEQEASDVPVEEAEGKVRGTEVAIPSAVVPAIEAPCSRAVAESSGADDMVIIEEDVPELRAVERSLQRQRARLPPVPLVIPAAVPSRAAAGPSVPGVTPIVRAVLDRLTREAEPGPRGEIVNGDQYLENMFEAMESGGKIFPRTPESVVTVRIQDPRLAVIPSRVPCMITADLAITEAEFFAPDAPGNAPRKRKLVVHTQQGTGEENCKGEEVV